MSNLPSNIIELNEFDESINLLVYGPSGVGKTVFGGSAQRVLFVAVEKGTVSAKRLGSKAKVWPVHEWNDLEAAYNWLADNPDEFDWVVLDSITEMQQLAIRDILKKANIENSSRDLDIPAIQDHQKWQNIYKRFISYFVDLPINVLFLALVRTAQDEDKEEFLTPDIQGKNYQLSQYTCGQMSAYGYMSSRKVALKDDEGNIVLDSAGKKIPHIIRRITWMDTGVIRGKDRYNVLEPYTEDLTLAEVYDLIDGEATREELGQFIRPKPKSKSKPKPKFEPKSATKAKAAVEDEPTEIAKPKDEPAEDDGFDGGDALDSKDKSEQRLEEAKPKDEPTEDDGFGEEAEVAKAEADEDQHKSEKADESNDDEFDEFDDINFD